MWTIIKADNKKIEFLKKDLVKKLGTNTSFYTPKLSVQKYRNNKLINKKLPLLGDYFFCFHSNLKNKKYPTNKLKFSRGLKYILNDFIQSQNEIIDFINKCKKSENSEGHLSTNFLNLKINSYYKFANGPFADTIFKIINLNKNKIDILTGNIRTKINRNKFLINPA